MSDNSPAISVILPVYNGESYLNEAICSILGQTLSDFELIVINDGSKDHSEEVIRSFHDDRIVYIKQENRGLAATLNRGIELAKGRYIARQDQDDISLPERFSEQFVFLESHPEVAMVGTWAEIFSEAESNQRFHRHPTEDYELKFDLLFDNPFVHSSMMIRKDAIRDVGGYTTDKDRQPPEDYELWSRIARKYAVGNIGKVLVRYREVAGSMSRDGISPFLEKVMKIAAENHAFIAGQSQPFAAGNDVVELYHGFPHHSHVRSSWRDIQDHLKTVVGILSQGNGEKKTRLWQKGKKILNSKKLVCRYYHLPSWLIPKRDGMFWCMVKRIFHVVRRFLKREER